MSIPTDTTRVFSHDKNKDESDGSDTKKQVEEEEKKSTDEAEKMEVDEVEDQQVQTKHEGGWAYVSSQADSTTTTTTETLAATSSDLPLEADTVTVRKEKKKYMMMYWTDLCSLPTRPDMLYPVSYTHLTLPTSPKV